VFDVGQLYDRRRDIHGPLGGQQQGGICTPQKHPYVVLFTGESGHTYGYKDGWDENGVFLYTGEGQAGDMAFVRGNRAIRDHAQDGKDLLLFEALGKRKPVRYIGTFACAGWEERRGPDKDGNDRKVIVFQLVKAGEEVPPQAAAEPIQESLEALRQRAYQAAQLTASSSDKECRRRYYKRAEDVRVYVLARANGVCEACGKAAPFVRSTGVPYLEPHHIRRVSDGGPDDPRWVAAVCPNCHREAHFGKHSVALNKRLADLIVALEKADS
jgi:5-methylcytosine-specific restriction protein A